MFALRKFRDRIEWRKGRRAGGRGRGIGTGKASQQHPFASQRGRCAAAGRKREINIARRGGELGSGGDRRAAVRAGDWNWNWTAVRPERYIFLNILVTVRNRLVTQPCHLLPATHYVPTTYQVRAWASPRVRRAFLASRNPLPFSFALPLSPSFSLLLVPL